MAQRHRVAVTFTGGRYGYTPTCSCGWITRGYVAEHAAKAVADDHKESV
jgi:hypothetical protein